MNLQKLNPWNWFKHEETPSGRGNIPVKREQTAVPASYGADWDNPIAQLHNHIDRWFDEAFRSFGLPSPGSRFTEPGGWLGAAGFHPSLDVASNDRSYEIKIEAPGMDESDLAVEVNDDVLTIKGYKQQEAESKDQHYYRIERNYGAFQRVLALPDDANADAIEAHMKKGVLSIHIPRREAPNDKVRRITINH